MLKKHSVVIAIKKFVDHETLAFLCFLVGSLFITNYKPYVLLLGLYVSVVYFLSQDFVKAAWQGFVGSLLFYKAKYFVFPFVANLAQSYGYDVETPFIFHTTFADVMLIVLLYSLFRSRNLDERPANSHHRLIALLMGLLLMVGACASWFSRFPEVSWFSLFKIAEYFVIFFTAMQLLRDKKILTTTSKNILLFVFFNAILILLQKLHGGPLGLPAEDFSAGSLGRFSDENISLYRPGGIYFEPNLPATLMVIFLPLVGWLSVAKAKKSLWFTTPFFVLLFAILATASRVNWIITVLVIISLYVLIPVSYKVKHRSELIKIGFLIGMGVLIQLPLLINRLLSLGVAFTDQSGGYSFRLRHLELAYEFMVNNLFGIGVDVFQYQILESMNPDRYYFHFTSAHNLLAEVAAGFGVMGFILYSFLLWIVVCYLINQMIVFWKRGRLSRSSLQQVNGVFLAVGYLGFIVSSMFFPWLFAPPLSEVTWIVLAMIYGYSKI